MIREAFMRKAFNYYKGSGLSMYHSCDSSPCDSINPNLLKMHAHDSYEIYFFISGNCSYIVEGHRYELVPGSIMIMRPAEIHCLIMNGNIDYERISINFLTSFLNEIDPDKLLTESFINRNLGELNLYTPNDFPVNASGYFMRMLTAPAKESEYEKQLAILSYIIPLLYEIREVYLKKKLKLVVSEPNSVMLDYINNNLEGDLSLDALGGLFNLSKSQLNRQFKKLTGTTIGEYVNAKRLLLAHDCILSGASATTTSLECGFRDYSAFYRAYRKKYGAAPTNKTKAALRDSRDVTL